MRTARVRLSLAPIVLSLVAACGADAPPPVAPPLPSEAPVSAAPAWAPPAPVAPRAAFDPVAVGLTAEGVRKVCDEHLARASALIGYIKGFQGAPAEKLTTAETLDRWDEIAMEVQDASLFPYLMGQAHPDKAVRDAAKECEPKADAFTTSLYLDAGLATVMKAYAARGEALSGERARLLADVLRDFRRNGADLPPEKQAQLRALSKELTDLGQKFESNIAESKNGIKVAKKQLDGLPKEWIAKHAPDASGHVFVSTDYPDSLPFLTYAKDRKAARDLYVEFTNRGGDANVELLGKVLERRRQKANLLGYPTWAAFAIEPRMAKTPDAVKQFLSTVSEAVKEPAKVEYAEILKEHVALGGKPTDTLTVADRLYLKDRVRARKYKLDSKEVAQYFEVSAVTKGLLDVTAKMYGLEYRPIHAASWHPDVMAFEVWSSGQDLGTIYLDLYSRPDKFKHAAEFTIRAARRLADGTYQKPAGALECNFPKPGGGGEPALMGHDQVEVFFHEFGHLLHNILTTAELATYSGANTVQDFVEAPSQMFEEWVWSREVLDLFARHHKTGKKLPEPLFKAMLRARAQGRALDTQRQLHFATVDLDYHTRDPGFDTTAVWMDVARRVSSLAELPGTHPQSSFGHIIGYDAGYYSYQWALSLSRDVLTRFRKEGLLNPATAKAWRDGVLAKGGGVDARSLVAGFLGREPNADAYIQFLGGKD